MLDNGEYGIFDLYPGNFGIDNGKIYVIDGATIPKIPGTNKFDETIKGISESMRDNVRYHNTHKFPELKKGGKTHKPFGHRSILDNGWQSTKQLKNKKNVYGK